MLPCSLASLLPPPLLLTRVTRARQHPIKKSARGGLCRSPLGARTRRRRGATRQAPPPHVHKGKVGGAPHAQWRPGKPACAARPSAAAGEEAVPSARAPAARHARPQKALHPARRSALGCPLSLSVSFFLSSPLPPSLGLPRIGALVLSPVVEVAADGRSCSGRAEAALKRLGGRRRWGAGGRSVSHHQHVCRI